MRITVATILFALVLLISSNALLDTISFSSTYEAEIEISELITNAEQMSARGPGSRITVDVDIPADTKVVLGTMPGEEDSWPAGANNYYIQSGPRKDAYKTDAFFTNFERSGPASITTGPHRLVIESIREPSHGRILIMVYEADI
jgi:hypothetical protein